MSTLSLKKKAKTISWTEPGVLEVLLHLIIVNGAHIATKDNSKQKWIKINREFYQNELCARYKPEDFNEDKYKKLQEKFQDTMKEKEKFVSNGNKSKMDGDLDSIFEMIKQIENDIDTNDEEKLAKKSISNKCDDNESAALGKGSDGKPIIGWGKRKTIDGQLVTPDAKKGKNYSNSSGTKSFEDKLLELLPGNNASGLSIEEKTEKTMIKWIQVKNKSIPDIITEGKIHVDYGGDYDSSLILEDLEVDLMVHTYCTRNQNFDLVAFREWLQKEGLQQRDAFKVGKVFSQWRQSAREDEDRIDEFDGIGTAGQRLDDENENEDQIYLAVAANQETPTVTSTNSNESSRPATVLSI